MKRRAGDGAKVRRPLKRAARLGDSLYSSTLLYLKFLLLWVIVILADFILEFRFEFLWPFWMLLRSVYDSFKYQGLAFSMFFVCIALTSDMICFFFIPVQWVFFAASTYVWVQYIWYTEKGICLPTIILCSVFIYMEAGVRLRDLRHMPAHLDLCRPFAAHCIGYPVVTLGFGFKSYVSYRMRKRRQQEVSKENSFYMQLLQQALPPQEDGPDLALKEPEKGLLSLDKVSDLQIPEKQMNGNAVHLQSSKSSFSKKSDVKNHQNNEKILSSSHVSSTPPHNFSNHTSPMSSQSSNYKDTPPEVGGDSAPAKNHSSQNHNGVVSNANTNKDKDKEQSKIYNQVTQNSVGKHAQSNGGVGHFCSDKSAGNGSLPADKDASFEKCSTPAAQTDPVEQKSPAPEVNVTESETICDKNVKGSFKNNPKLEKKDSNTSQREERRKNKNKDKDKDNSDNSQKHDTKEKDKDAESKASNSATEKALRAALAAERQARSELTQLKQQVDQLTSKLNLANASRQADRTALATAERQLNEEKRARQAASARLRGLHKSGDCGWDWCRQKRTNLEQEIAGMRDEMQQVREQNQTLTQSFQAAEQQIASLEARARENDSEAWHATAKSLHERCVQLECSLSAETRVKLDLFSAVGETKRQLDMREDLIRQLEKQNEEFKAKFAQMVAVMPNDSFSPNAVGGLSKLMLSDNGIPCYPSHLTHHNVGNSLNTIHSTNSSNLDPNATIYMPKDPAEV